VIGIIAVLIGILLPVIGRARSQANTVACMATLRNLGQALYIYAGENKGSLPFSYYTSSMPSGNTEVAQDGNSTVYVWWGVLRAYMRKGSNVDNSVINNDGSTSTRFMRAFACPEGHDPEAGCDYGSNMVAMPELNWESYAFYRSVNQPVAPARLTQLYADNFLLWDACEIGPNFNTQYVCGYELDSGGSSAYNRGSFSWPTRSYLRYRSMAAIPTFVPAGSEYANDMPIYPGTNRDVMPGASAGQRGNIRWRHGRQDMANFLCADGTVRSMKITTGTPGKPGCKGDCLHSYFRIKAPPRFKAFGYLVTLMQVC
jgi:hypothetical protein